MSEQSRPLISVVTPTYDRAHTLPRLFASLERQNCQEFEWIVIDDGSTDDTQTLLHEWAARHDGFALRHDRVPHGGAIRAMNKGIELAHGEYIMLVGSDDFLVDDAISLVSSWIPDSRRDPKCLGVGAIHGWESGQETVQVPIPPGEEYLRCSNLDRAKHGLRSDMNEAYRADVLKEHPFPVWTGEIFAPEQIVFDQLSLDGWFLHWYDRVICLGDHQSGGLSSGADLLMSRNPMGFAMLANHRLKHVRGKDSVQSAVQHIALSVVGKNPSHIRKSNRPWLTALMLPVGLVWALRRRIQYAQYSRQSLGSS